MQDVPSHSFRSRATCILYRFAMDTQPLGPSALPSPTPDTGLQTQLLRLGSEGIILRGEEKN